VQFRLEQLKNGSLERQIFSNIDRLYPMACDTHRVRTPPTMGYRNKAIRATKGGLRCAECSAAAEKSVLTCPKMAKNARRNARETLEKRSRNALGIGQHSVSMHSTNNDGGVANSQRVGEGG
jgi:hypothetical protein